MADETDVPISFTANIESLQKGVNAGEELIETLVKRINDLNTALGTVGTAGAPVLLAELEKVKAELQAAQGLTAQLASQMAGIKLNTDGGGQSLQSRINEMHRLGEEILSASANSKALSNTLGTQGVSATEAAMAEKQLAAELAAVAAAAARTDFATNQARGRQEVTSTISALMGEKQAVDRITLSNSELAASWAKVNSIQTATPAAAFWDQFNSKIRMSNEEVKLLTQSMGALNQQAAETQAVFARSDAGAAQARGREQVNATIAALMGEKQAVDRVTASTSLLAQEWNKVQSIQTSVSGRDYWANYNRQLGIGVANTERITKQTSMFGESTDKVGRSMGGLHVQTAGVTREIIVLAHEATVGNFSRIPGSLMVLTERFGGLTFATLGWFAAIGITAGVVGYFTVRAIELAQAVKNINIGAEFSGNAAITNTAIESTIVELAKLKGMTRETAGEVVSSFARMRNMSEAELVGLSLATARFARATGTDAKQAAGELTAILEKETISTRDLLKTFPGLTDAQLENSRAALQNGNDNERAAAIMTLLGQSLDTTRESQIKANSGMFDSGKNFMTYVGLLEAGIPYQKIENMIIGENAKKWDEAAEAMRKAAAAKKNMPLTPEQNLLRADEAGDSEDPTGLSIAKTKRNIEAIKSGIAELKIFGKTQEDEEHLKRLNHQLAEANAHLTQLTHKDTKRLELGTNLAGIENMRQTRELNAEMMANTKLSAEQQHDIITSNWKRLLAEGKLTAAQRTEVERDMWQSVGAASRAGGVLTVEQGRLEIAKVNADETKGNAERLSGVVAVWAKVLASDKLTFQQRIQAETDYYRAVSQLNKDSDKNKEQIARSDSETSRQLSRLRIQQEREDTQELWKERQLSSADRLSSLINLIREEGQLNLDAVDEELKTLHEGEANYEAAMNRRKIIAAQTEADIARVRREAAAEDRQTAREEVTTHRLAMQEILSTERLVTRDIIGGKKSAAEIAGGIIDNLLEKEIEADLTYLTKHIMMTKAELLADKTSGQAGLLWDTLFKGEKIALAVGEEATITGAKVAGETARTAATAAGETARLGVKSAARAASSGVELASGSAQIMNDAYKSAAGAYSAVVGIPYIGPILAPIAAGTAFAAVAAFDTLTSLDTGAWSVPRDMPAYIHQGESVVPKTFAEGLRDNGSLSGGSADAKNVGAQLNYAPTINAPQHKSLHQLLYNESSTMLKFLNEAIRNGDLSVGRV